MKQEKISVLVIKPNEEPALEEIDNNLKACQKVVGGWIEYVGLEDDIALICNEEGKLDGLPANRVLNLDFFQDTIMGTFFITGTNDDGEFVSLKAKQIEKYTKLLSLGNGPVKTLNI